MSWPYRQIAVFTERQHGQIAHVQLSDLGVGRGAIRYGLRTGRVRETFRGVCALGDLALPALWREHGAVLSCDPGAFVSRRAALVAWGVVRRTGEIVDITVPYARNPRRPGIRVHRSREIDPRDVTSLEGIPIATPAFALLEIATELSFEALERAFDDALTSKVVSLRDAQQTLAHHPHSPGAQRFAALARPDHEFEITRSIAEQLMKALVRKGGLIGWRLNRRQGRIVPDLVFDAEKVIVEVDGFRTHGTRKALESDRARDAKLAAGGWIVLRFTWRQLTEQPELVLVQLAQTLAIRRAA